MTVVRVWVGTEWLLGDVGSTAVGFSSMSLVAMYFVTISHSHYRREWCLWTKQDLQLHRAVCIHGLHTHPW